MTKIVAYAVRPDEKVAFERFAKALELDIKVVPAQLGIHNVGETQGYEAVTFLGNCDVSKDVVDAMHANGVQYLASRSAGFNNVDLDAVKRNGMHFSNATYSPYCVSDFAVMLILMSVRNMKAMMKRNEAHDYSLPGLQGKEMHNLTFGVVGTGRIGAAVAQSLKGFGGRIIGFDVYQNPSLEGVLEYVSLDTLFEQADVITLHTPLLESTMNLVNDKTLAQTKPGVVIVNCARSELIDTSALIRALDSGHIGAAALDVFPHEIGIVHTDNRMKGVVNHDLAILQHKPNVIVTPHSAFYTDQAVSDMVEVALTSLKSFVATGESKWEIK